LAPYAENGKWKISGIDLNIGLKWGKEDARRT